MCISIRCVSGAAGSVDTLGISLNMNISHLIDIEPYLHQYHDANYHNTVIMIVNDSIIRTGRRPVSY